MAADDSELEERAGREVDVRRECEDSCAGDGHDGCVRCHHGDGLADSNMRHAPSDCDYRARGGVPRAMRERDRGIRKPQVLGSLGSRGNGARLDSHGYLTSPRRGDVDRKQLGSTAVGPHDRAPAQKRRGAAK
jgi:hypothetical protein